MRWTPLRVRQAELPVTLRGYDRAATEQLLGEVADDYEAALWQRKELRERVAALKAEQAVYVEQQRLISATLVEATRFARALEREARRRARTLVKRGQLEAEAARTASERQCDRLVEKAGAARSERDRLQERVRRLRLLAEDTRAGLWTQLTGALERIQAETAARGQDRPASPEASVVDDLRPDPRESALWTLEEPPEAELSREGEQPSDAGASARELSTEPG